MTSLSSCSWQKVKKNGHHFTLLTPPLVHLLTQRWCTSIDLIRVAFESCVHRLATWVTLLPRRVLLDLRKNTGSKEWALSHNCMDLCMSPCMNPLQGRPSPSGMSQVPHKAGLPELKPTKSHLLINPSFVSKLCWHSRRCWVWINRNLAAGYYTWLLNGMCGKEKHKIPRGNWRYTSLRCKGDNQDSLSKKEFCLWLAWWASLGKSFDWQCDTRIKKLKCHQVIVFVSSI